MKRWMLFALIALAVGGIVLSGCKKKEDSKPTPEGFSTGLYKVTGTKVDRKVVSIQTKKEVEENLRFLKRIAMAVKDETKANQVKEVIVDAFVSISDLGLEFKADNKVSLNLAKGFDKAPEGSYMASDGKVVVKFGELTPKNNAGEWEKVIAAQFSGKEVTLAIQEEGKLEWALPSSQLYDKVFSTLRSKKLEDAAAALEAALKMAPKSGTDYKFYFTKVR